MNKKLSLHVLRLAAAVALLGFPPAAGAQEKDARASDSAAASVVVRETDAKAEEVLRRALEAIGGSAYLGARTVVSRGYFTPFKDGVGGLPVKFFDYVAFPERSRTEFSGQGVRSVQVHEGDGGWAFDGMVRKILDLKPEQVRAFRTAQRTSLDNLLRGWWREAGASLSYVGRREAGVGRRNEAVRLIYPDGFVVEFEFGSRDYLPAKTLYKKQNDEGEEVAEEDRYAQFVKTGGVSVPFIIDHFRAGVQSSRVNFESVEFNRTLPDSLFARPADVKAIKFGGQ